MIHLEIFTPLQTIVCIFVVLAISCFHVFELKHKIERRCKRKRRLLKAEYFKKNWLEKLFFIGAGEIIEIELFVLNIIEKILTLFTIIIGMLHLIFYTQTLTLIFKVSVLAELIISIVFGLLAGSFRTYSKRDD